MASKAGLVDQVKAIQRTGPDAKQAWWAYCDQKLEGVKDPNRHEEHTLLDFIAQYQSGNIAVSPPPTVGGTIYPSPHTIGGWSPAPQPAWGAVGLGKGAGKGGGKDGGKDANIGLLVKEGQKKSQRWRESWQKYCAVYGNGFNDPTRHPNEFINGFLDYLGGLASGDLDAQAEKQGVDFESRGIKRSSDDGLAWMPGAKRPAAIALDPEKAELVEKIKSLQRTVPEMKHAWESFCDESCGGVRDPARQDVSMLRVFLGSQATV
eukprot:CAMPEP_0198542586 /NCGR_PEP_ID=MMETSP1462-20131121/58050_1 /TAXON_ID=1333877 /ORGANISM="Brandtodinium nutriculum, Strain RCC3387" /LENGTH=262 /DNA_ID=CAMNT_0044272817 /DNA_START=81 /DNA_END=869 /DNA_ORIENTATION=+